MISGAEARSPEPSVAAAADAAAAPLPNSSASITLLRVEPKPPSPISDSCPSPEPAISVVSILTAPASPIQTSMSAMSGLESVSTDRGPYGFFPLMQAYEGLDAHGSDMSISNIATMITESETEGDGANLRPLRLPTPPADCDSDDLIMAIDVSASDDGRLEDETGNHDQGLEELLTSIDTNATMVRNFEQNVDDLIEYFRSRESMIEQRHAELSSRLREVRQLLQRFDETLEDLDSDDDDDDDGNDDGDIFDHQDDIGEVVDDEEGDFDWNEDGTDEFIIVGDDANDSVSEDFETLRSLYSGRPLLQQIQRHQVDNNDIHAINNDINTIINNSSNNSHRLFESVYSSTVRSAHDQGGQTSLESYSDLGDDGTNDDVDYVHQDDRSPLPELRRNRSSSLLRHMRSGSRPQRYHHLQHQRRGGNSRSQRSRTLDALSARLTATTHGAAECDALDQLRPRMDVATGTYEALDHAYIGELSEEAQASLGDADIVQLRRGWDSVIVWEHNRNDEDQGLGEIAAESVPTVRPFFLSSSDDEEDNSADSIRQSISASTTRTRITSASASASVLALGNPRIRASTVSTPDPLRNLATGRLQLSNLETWDPNYVDNSLSRNDSGDSTEVTGPSNVALIGDEASREQGRRISANDSSASDDGWEELAERYPYSVRMVRMLERSAGILGRRHAIYGDSPNSNVVEDSLAGINRSDLTFLERAQRLLDILSNNPQVSELTQSALGPISTSTVDTSAITTETDSSSFPSLLSSSMAPTESQLTPPAFHSLARRWSVRDPLVTASMNQLPNSAQSNGLSTISSVRSSVNRMHSMLAATSIRPEEPLARDSMDTGNSLESLILATSVPRGMGIIESNNDSDSVVGSSRSLWSYSRQRQRSEIRQSRLATVSDAMSSLSLPLSSSQYTSLFPPPIQQTNVSSVIRDAEDSGNDGDDISDEGDDLREDHSLGTDNLDISHDQVMLGIGLGRTTRPALDADMVDYVDCDDPDDDEVGDSQSAAIVSWTRTTPVRRIIVRDITVRTDEADVDDSGPVQVVDVVSSSLVDWLMGRSLLDGDGNIWDEDANEDETCIAEASSIDRGNAPRQPRGVDLPGGGADLLSKGLDPDGNSRTDRKDEIQVVERMISEKGQTVVVFLNVDEGFNERDELMLSR